jgi:phenylalanyl-tRNA synthetase beta subunit
MSTERLRQLFAYLNLDWDLDYRSVEAAVAEFVRTEPREVVDAAIAELDGLIELKLDEDTLKSLLTEMGCGYWPYGSGTTFRTWLPELRKSIKTESDLHPGA